MELVNHKEMFEMLLYLKSYSEEIAIKIFRKIL